MARNPRTLLRELIDQAARNENCVDALRAVVDEYSSDEGGEKGPGPDLLAALSSTLEGLPLSSLCSVKPLSRSVLKLLRLGAIFVPDFVKRLLVDMPSWCSPTISRQAAGSDARNEEPRAYGRPSSRPSQRKADIC